MRGKRGGALRVAQTVVMLLSALSLSKSASADVFNMPAGQTSVKFVTVGDPGNAAYPTTPGFGAVAYTYEMGEFDVTAAQYTQFLNAVARTDPYGLYNVGMGTVVFGNMAVCGITQSGSSGNYAYSVVSADANFPVVFVDWGSAARFANWLTNGEPSTGVENASTTESGSYALNGATSESALLAVTRSASAKYVIPTNNEWYKAAYYKGGSVNAGYWLYPTQSNSAPSNVLSATGTNNANYFTTKYTDPTNYLTSVGAFAASPSPYGTFDQGGDVFQWTEDNEGSSRGNLGGAFGFGANLMQAGGTGFGNPLATDDHLGFRIAEVPEPSSVVMVIAVGVGLLRRHRGAQPKLKC